MRVIIFLKEKIFYVEKGFTFGFFFKKKKNKWINSPIVQKSSGFKLALLCICPDSHACVAIYMISLH